VVWTRPEDYRHVADVPYSEDMKARKGKRGPRVPFVPIPGKFCLLLVLLLKYFEVILLFGHKFQTHFLRYTKQIVITIKLCLNDAFLLYFFVL